MSEINERGNTVTRRHGDHGDRYHYDFKACRHTDGWRQYDTDQDAWYFGVWVHLERRIVITYAEGDEITVRCPDEAHLKAELDSMAAFYGEPPPAFCVIHEDGSLTKHYDERPAL